MKTVTLYLRQTAQAEAKWRTYYDMQCKLTTSELSPKSYFQYYFKHLNTQIGTHSPLHLKQLETLK